MQREADLTDWEKRDVSITEVMQIFTIGRATVWRWVKSGRLPEPKKYGPQTRRWNGAELAKIRGEEA